VTLETPRTDEGKTVTGAAEGKKSAKDEETGAKTEATEATAKDSVAAAKEEPVPLKALRVLVVEDTIPVQKLLTRWLQNQGCVVTCASNGKIGLDHLMKSPFDIAFVDFLMVKIHNLYLYFLL
jgi:PleD family two-component response regulator